MRWTSWVLLEPPALGEAARRVRMQPGRQQPGRVRTQLATQFWAPTHEEGGLPGLVGPRQGPTGGRPAAAAATSGGQREATARGHLPLTHFEKGVADRTPTERAERQAHDTTRKPPHWFRGPRGGRRGGGGVPSAVAWKPPASSLPRLPPLTHKLPTCVGTTLMALGSVAGAVAAESATDSAGAATATATSADAILSSGWWWTLACGDWESKAGS